MKSSHRVIPGQGERKVFSWQPVEIGVGSGQPREKDVRALIDVFRPENPDEDEVPAAMRDAGAAVRGAAQPWEPSDFGQPAQFVSGEKKAVAYFPVTMGRRDSVGGFAARGGNGFVDLARREAEEVLACARQQADQIISEANQAAAVEFERAQQEGYAAGRAEIDRQLNAIRQVFEQTNAWREELFTASEPIVLQLVKSIAVAMFGQGVELSDSALQQNLNRIVEQAKSLGDIKIYLNPADAAILDPDWREFQTSITGNRVQVISSDSITRGGAFVQGQMGTVDGRVETQLKAVLDALAGTSEGEGSPA